MSAENDCAPPKASAGSEEFTLAEMIEFVADASSQVGPYFRPRMRNGKSINAEIVSRLRASPAPSVGQGLTGDQHAALRDVRDRLEAIGGSQCELTLATLNDAFPIAARGRDGK